MKKQKIKTDPSFWDNKWIQGKTFWDIGYASPPITDFFAKFTNKKARILIPGCGNAHEAEFLINHGFSNITLLDISETKMKDLRNRFSGQSVKFICEDFFEHEGEYDIIIEQTFFCAISVNLREEYVKKVAHLLEERGQIVGVLFNREFDRQGPPFGGNILTYKDLFSTYFNIKKMEECYNSIPQRLGSEVFIQLIKKD